MIFQPLQVSHIRSMYSYISALVPKNVLGWYDMAEYNTSTIAPYNMGFTNIARIRMWSISGKNSLPLIILKPSLEYSLFEI
jgi:hypothetical protein